MFSFKMFKEVFWEPFQWLCLATQKALEEHLDTQRTLEEHLGTGRALKELLDLQALEGLQGHFGTRLLKTLWYSRTEKVYGHLNTWYLFSRLDKYGLRVKIYTMMKWHPESETFLEIYCFS